MNNNEYQKKWRNERKKNGYCVGCGEKLDREGFYCKKCREKINKNVREQRHWYQDNGICPRCGKNSLFGDEKVCPECNAIFASQAEKTREKNRELYNEKQRIIHKKIYVDRKERGLCTRCGKRKPDYGYFTCGICREKDRVGKRIRYGKSDRSDRYLQGPCYFCDNPVKPGYKVCEKHYQRNVKIARSQKANEARKALEKKGILY